jgi:branched-chain amino acid transport system permease protein
MSAQFLVDGTLAGLLIGLGAIGVTLTYAILRFANFAHGEFVTVGAYAAWSVNALIAAVVGVPQAALGPFSFPASVVASGLAAMALTAGLAVLLDRLLFQRLRRHGAVIVMVMASFGASMALRSLVEFLYSSRPVYFTRELQIATRLGLGIRITPDQLVLIATTLAVLAAVHAFVTRSQTGRAMRAVSENPALARVAGIDVEAVTRWTWILGGALAAAAGTMSGILVQIRPFMGFDLLLPLFAAAILGGIGSIPGAVAGGLVIGIAEAAAVQLVGAEWRAAIAFLLLILMLLVRPRGLFGARA